MSLKAFHIFFIGVSTALSFGFSAWLFQQYADNRNGWTLASSCVSMLVGVALIGYGIRFLKKLRHVSYL